MLKKLVSWAKSLFTKTPKESSKSTVKYGDVVGNVKIERPYQLDKHTNFKVGESYRIGEFVVTLRSSKAEVSKVLAQVEANRAAKEAKRRERAIQIMLMTPEELLQFQIYEWLDKRMKQESIHTSIIGKLTGKRYSPPVEIEPPAGSKALRFKQLLKDLEKEDEKIS
jgi:hypothetical protein